MTEPRNSTGLESIAAIVNRPAYVPHTETRPMAAEPLTALFAWIVAACYVSPRVSARVERLWRSYVSSGGEARTMASRDLFLAQMEREFDVRQGMAVGICLAADRASYLGEDTGSRQESGRPTARKQQRRAA